MRQLENHHGFTLAELMVSILLGSLVMLVLVAAYGSLKSSSSVQREYLSLRSDLRVVHQAIRKELLKAGYRSDMGSPLANVFPGGALGAGLGTFWAGQYLDARRELNQTGTQTTLVKQLAIRFQGDLIESEDGNRFMTDCLGNQVPDGVVVTMFFRWAQVQPPAGSQQLPEPADLTCSSSLSVPAFAAQVLFSDVSNIEFHLGQDTDLDGEIDQESEELIGSSPVLRVRTMVELAASEAIGDEDRTSPAVRLEQVTNLRGPGL